MEEEGTHIAAVNLIYIYQIGTSKPQIPGQPEPLVNCLPVGANQPIERVHTRARAHTNTTRKQQRGSRIYALG